MQLSTQDLTELPVALSSVCMTAVVAYMSHNHQADPSKFYQLNFTKVVS